MGEFCAKPEVFYFQDIIKTYSDQILKSTDN